MELVLPAGSETQGLAELVAVRRGQSLSRRAVRRSIERLWATGRFTDVVARAVEEPEGLRVVFLLTPIRPVVSAAVDGNTLLTDEALLEVAGLSRRRPEEGEDFGRATEAIAEAYARRGYDRARVAVELTEAQGGLDVRFSVEEGAPTRVGAISFAGDPGLALARLTEAFGLEVGAVLDRSALETGVERLRQLYRQERHWRARIDTPVVTREGARARISVPVTAGPSYEVRFQGNRSISDARLRALLGYDGEESLDRGVTARLERTLENFYRSRGLFDVRARAREALAPDGSRAALIFDIDEGRQLRVEQIEFGGSEAISSGELREVLSDTMRALEPAQGLALPANDDPLGLEGRTAKRQRSLPPPADPAAVFVEAGYREAARAMTETYRRRGFLQASVELVRVDRELEARTARVRFEVKEGPQTFVREVALRGAPQELLPRLSPTLRIGAPLTREDLDRQRVELGRRLAREGYLFNRVETQVEIAPGGERARVLVLMDPGPRVRVGQVILKGLARSDEAMVRANLALAEGQVLDPERLYDSQRNLARLGIFRQVVVKLIAPEAVEATKDVVVEVRERPRVDGELAGGYFLVEGPRVVVDATYANINGHGLNLVGRGKLNYVGASALAIDGSSAYQGIDGLGGRGNLALVQPRIYSLLPFQIGSRLDLIGERVHRPSYVFTRFAAVAGLDWTAAPWLSAGLQYELEHDRVVALSDAQRILTAIGRADEERLRFPFGIFSLHSLRPSLALDFRDDPTQPRRGLLVTTTAEITRDFYAGLTGGSGAVQSTFPIFTLKTSGNVTVYTPLIGQTVLAISARGGRIFPLDPDSKTIAPKRFFLGGATSMRGFREDGLTPADRREELGREVASCAALANPAGCTEAAQALRAGNELPSEGGELFALGKAELRIPVQGALELGLFAEAGNLWLDPLRAELGRLRTVAGAGLRYVTPVGPLAFDLGFNLAPDPVVNESLANLHFSIGLF